MYKTGYHAKYLAHQITLKESSYQQSGIKRTIFDASIQLNPHQVEAALFAIRAAKDKGVILADEVGLGKTIEAGLVIAQTWSELKHKILIIAPNALVKQWKSELRDKFALESEIIDSQAFKKLANKGMNPFDQEKILITTYGMAKNKAQYLERTLLDLVVIDEAHKLRSKGVLHKELKQSLTGVKKILLTATPIQNSIDDLYNLCEFIDTEAFNDKNSYSYLYRNHPEEIKDSIQSYLHRTLRKQVKDYVKYPKRVVKTYDFALTNEELVLYQALTEYLQSEDSYLLKNNRNGLIKTTLRKKMASSTAALISVLETLVTRLYRIHRENKDQATELNEWLSESLDDWDDEFEKEAWLDESSMTVQDLSSALILHEIKKLNQLIELAKQIKDDSRAFKLVEVLKEAFKGLEAQKGANKKVLIFTESVQTQNYLYEFLKKQGYDKVVRFSGQNNTPDCREIFEKWRRTHEFSESKATAMRDALVHEFKNHAEIMIATEAGAEGLNLQFCSTLINYDLPWNPQRIEQRIGRCHRYGQPVDVVIFNFINQSNKAERRLYEILSSKTGLFEDMFDSSDAILGILDEGDELEKKIKNIYRTCRTDDEVERAFEELQQKSKHEINKKMKETKQRLNQYFDEEISLRFKASEKELRRQLSELEERFWELSKIQLHDLAYFQGMEDDFKFILPNEVGESQRGIYQLHTHFKEEDQEDVILYRTNSPLGQHVIQTALDFDRNLEFVEFDLTNYPANITSLNQFKGLNGYLSVIKLKTTGIVNQERLVLSAIMEDYRTIPAPILNRLFNVNGQIKEHSFYNPFVEMKVKEYMDSMVKLEVERINQSNNDVYQKKKESIMKESKLQRQALKGVIEEKECLRDELEYKLENSPNPEECEQIEQELDRIEQELDELRQNQGIREKQVRERRSRKLNELKQQLQYETEELFTIRFAIK